MGFIKRYKLEILLGIGLLALYIVLRLINILQLPPFTDEEIYIRWAQIAAQDSSWRFISLTDGKQPMYVWFAMILLRFIHDPLFAGRLVSIVTGIGTMVGLWVLTWEMFRKRWIAFLTVFLYVIFPFALVYDRMALYESMVGMFVVWSLYVEVLLVRKVRWDLAFVLALVLGGAVLTKSSGFINMALIVVSLLLFNFSKEKRARRFLTWVGCAVLALGLATVYYSVLRLSPYFGIINEKNATFVYPLGEWLRHPIEYFIGNLRGLFDWLLGYMNWTGIILAGASFFVLKKFWKEKIILLIWFLAPFLYLALFGKVIYPRYIYAMTLTLLPLIAISLYTVATQVKQKYVKFFIIVFFLAWYLRTDYFIVFDFAHAPIAGPDLTQYVNAWPAGGGVKEMVAYFNKVSVHQKIYVASEGTFGSVPTLAVEIFLDKNKNVEKRGMWPLPEDIPQDLLEKAKTMPVYMVFEQTQKPPKGWPVKLVIKYQKGIGDWYMSIYQVIP